MIFYVNKKQKIYLSKDRKKILVKRFFRFILILFVLICLIFFFAYRIKIFNFLLIDKNLFSLRDIKINIFDSYGNLFLKNGDFIRNIVFIDNLFLLKKDEIKDYIYKNFDSVKYVEIKKYYPHRLVVNIYPRECLFLLNGCENFALDEDGVVFRKSNLTFDLEPLYRVKVELCKINNKYEKFTEKIVLLRDFVEKLIEKNRDFYNHISFISVYDDKKICLLYENVYVLFGNVNKDIDVFNKTIYLKLAIENFNKNNFEKDKKVFLDASNFFIDINKKQENYGKMIFSYKDL